MTIQRCEWATHDELEMQYHDLEWGVPEHDETRLFELLILESMQAGLSWSIILRKRESMREAFDSFDYRLIANYSEAKIHSLLLNPGIIRNYSKVCATVTNAKSFMKIQDEFGSFSSYIWSFVDDHPIRGNWNSIDEVACSSPLSEAISKDLRRHGFKFIGSKTIYSYLQSAGIINDHIKSCFRYSQINSMSLDK